MKISTFRVLSDTIVNGETQFSRQFPFALNQALIIFNSQQNIHIYKIELYYTTIMPTVPSLQLQQPIKFFDLRFRGLNRDGSLITENAGIIKNGLSGDWNGSIPKSSDLDFVLSSKKNFIEFKNPIILGGIQLRSESIQLFIPANTFAYSSNMNIYYE
jgi:hypothetical protein